MNKGEVVQCDTPMEVYDRPRTRFVGEFIGTPPMNFLRASRGGRGRARVGDGTLPAWVEVVEPIGSQLLVTSTTGDQVVKLLTPTDFRVAPGDELWLRPDLERVGWFDPEGGARLDR
jgi:multiple sugar transport system ATP-binding protein